MTEASFLLTKGEKYQKKLQILGTESEREKERYEFLRLIKQQI